MSCLFHWKFHFTWKKSDLLLPDIYKTLNPFWISNWVSITRVVARFPQASLLLPLPACRDCQNLETPCIWSHLSLFNQPKLCRSSAPRAWPLILQSKPLIVLWSSLREWLPNDKQGLELGLKLELCLLTNRLKRLYLLRSPKINCVEFKFFLGLLKTPKLRTAVSWYPQDWANHQFLKNLEEFIQFDQIFQTAIICFGRFC